MSFQCLASTAKFVTCKCHSARAALVGGPGRKERRLWNLEVPIGASHQTLRRLEPKGKKTMENEKDGSALKSTAVLPMVPS